MPRLSVLKCRKFRPINNYLLALRSLYSLKSILDYFQMAILISFFVYKSIRELGNVRLGMSDPQTFLFNHCYSYWFQKCLQETMSLKSMMFRTKMLFFSDYSIIILLIFFYQGGDVENFNTTVKRLVQSYTAEFVGEYQESLSGLKVYSGKKYIKMTQQSSSWVRNRVGLDL